MELKGVIVVVCVLLTCTEAGIPRCCVTTQRNIPKRLLMKVYRWDVQHSDGACDIPALIFHVRGLDKPLCAHPHEKIQLIRLKLRMKQFQLSQAEKRL